MAGANRFFVDTNLLIYTLDSRNPSKQRMAARWRDCLWETTAGRLSWQVLNEFYSNTSGKIGLPRAQARAVVESYAEWQPIGFSLEIIRRAWHWVDRSGISYWDGLILASAEIADCRWLLSEDFQEGRQYGGVRVVNPFTSEPGEFFPGPRAGELPTDKS